MSGKDIEECSNECWEKCKDVLVLRDNFHAFYKCYNECVERCLAED